MELKKYKKIFDIEYRKQQLLNLDVFHSLNTFSSNNSSKISYPLEKVLFYTSRNVIQSLNTNENYDWKVDENKYKMLYMSYKTLNNKFDLAPEKSFINIDASETYYLDVSIDSTRDLYITPFVIHYRNEDKIKLTKIVSRNQQLIFHDGEDKCRLTFKIKGSGYFSIEYINLLILRQGVNR